MSAAVAAGPQRLRHAHLPRVSQLLSQLQYQADKAVPKEQRVWLRCDIDTAGENVVVCLAKRGMIQTAIRRGVGEPMYMDATHGLQKYGLKVVTVHVKDEENKVSWLPCQLTLALQYEA